MGDCAIFAEHHQVAPFPFAPLLSLIKANLRLPLLLCSQHPPYYSFRLHSAAFRGTAILSKKLKLNLKPEPHELAKQVRLSGCLGWIRKSENKDEKDG